MASRTVFERGKKGRASSRSYMERSCSSETEGKSASDSRKASEMNVNSTPLSRRWSPSEHTRSKNAAYSSTKSTRSKRRSCSTSSRSPGSHQRDNNSTNDNFTDSGIYTSETIMDRENKPTDTVETVSKVKEIGHASKTDDNASIVTVEGFISRENHSLAGASGAKSFASVFGKGRKMISNFFSRNQKTTTERATQELQPSYEETCAAKPCQSVKFDIDERKVKGTCTQSNVQMHEDIKKLTDTVSQISLKMDKHQTTLHDQGKVVRSVMEKDYSRSNLMGCIPNDYTFHCLFEYTAEEASSKWKSFVTHMYNRNSYPASFVTEEIEFLTKKYKKESKRLVSFLWRWKSHYAKEEELQDIENVLEEAILKVDLKKQKTKIKSISTSKESRESACLEDGYLKHLASCLSPHEWLDVGLSLGFNADELATMDRNNPHDITTAIYTMLTTWKKRGGGDFNHHLLKGQLILAFIKASRRDLANKIGGNQTLH